MEFKKMTRAGLSFAIALAMSAGSVPATGLAEALNSDQAASESVAATSDVATGQSLQEEGVDELSNKIKELAEGLSASDDALGELKGLLESVEVAQEFEGSSNAATLAALEGNPSTVEGITQAYVGVAKELGYETEVVEVEGGNPVVRVATNGDVVEFSVANLEEDTEAADDELAAEETQAEEQLELDTTSQEVADENESLDSEATSNENGPSTEVGLSAQASDTTKAPSISYAVHVQSIGDQSSRKDGKMAGTSGKSKRLEAIWLKLDSSIDGSIEYLTHVQSYGWEKSWSKDGALSGTRGESKRLEGIRIRLTGEIAKKYHVYYRVHCQQAGWLAWAKDGETSGSEGLSWRLEGIQVVLVEKGAEAPGTVDNITSSATVSFISNPGVAYKAHAQTHGWLDWVKNGANAGTSGESKRLESIQIKLDSTSIPGGIEYKTHIQGKGWEDSWASNGGKSGTEGEGKRLEAIQIKLTGEVAKYFDVWYCTHIQSFGWLGWAKNGETAGSYGLSRRMECMQIRLLPKGAAAPGSTENAYVDEMPFTSGDAELDSILNTIIETKTGRGSDALRKGFDYVTSLPYIDGEAGLTGDWRVWSIPKAKEMYKRPGGNCYYYGSLMAWIARALGYDARAVSGEVKSGVLSWSYHGWCEVTIDGQKLVLDPDLQKYIPNRNFYLVSYDDAPTYYTAY